MQGDFQIYFNIPLRFSAPIKLYDMSFAIFGYVSRSFHIISFPKNGVPYQGQNMVSCVSSDKNMYLSKKV